MSFKYTTCCKCIVSYEYYERNHIVPPCPTCGWPELKTREEYYKSMGITLCDEVGPEGDDYVQGKLAVHQLLTR